MDDTWVVVAHRDPEHLTLLRELLAARHEVRPCGAPADLEAVLGAGGVAVVVVELGFVDGPPTELLDRVHRVAPGADVIVLCGLERIAEAVSAMRAGAADFMLRGHEAAELDERVERILRRVRLSGPAPAPPDAPAADVVWGRSPRVREVCDLVRRVAPLPVPVLILGETGAGKEVFARLIHAQSRRAAGPFVAVNLAAIPSELVESTLFGHERGAFTGAVAKHMGKLAQAHGGTLFLDEVGEMRVDLQAKLLRALQEKAYEPVGGREPVPSDVRLISATNADLVGAVAQGAFRKDLFYRINVISFRLPALRDRAEDIPDLLSHFVRRYSAAFEKPLRSISPAAVEALVTYKWPGNIRELENKVQRAVALSEGPQLDLTDFFDLEMLDTQGFVREAAKAPGTLEEVEEAYIREVLRHTGGHQGDAATVLGIDRKTLYNKLLRYGLLAPRAPAKRAS
ncbi:MAG TPA: sigma-54 dependent transcriptional regulator [Polyangia bacterium]|jgi:DNA-binding NtrC family response regulator